MKKFLSLALVFIMVFGTQKLQMGYAATMHVGTAANLQMAFDIGGEIMLNADISTTTTLTVNEDTILNLNGHKLTNTVNVAFGKTLTFNIGTATDLQTAFNIGGEIVLNANIATVTALRVNKNSVLNLNGNKLAVTVSSGTGINIASDKTLMIKDSQYTIANPGSGKLSVINNQSTNTNDNGAGITTTEAELIIESGVIEAKGGSYGAGIGGNNQRAGGTVTINDGIVTATGGNGAAGIGGGGNGFTHSGMGGGIIIINGGTVTGIGGSNGAGIGGGSTSTSGSIPATGGGGGAITINGGTVFSTGGSPNGAGIGGGGASSSSSNRNATGGEGGIININGGNITATSTRGAGIGGGGASCQQTQAIGGMGGIINISGGNITATSSSGGAGIGGGSAWKVGGSSLPKFTGGAGGEITISGGTVTAKSNSSSIGIGAGTNPTGNRGESGTFTMDGNSLVFASSVSDTNTIRKTGGILFNDFSNTGTVYGNVTLETDLEIPDSKTLTIPDGLTLTVPEGVTLINNGTIINRNGGTITNGGTIENTGTITNDGDFTNSGTIIGVGTLDGNNPIIENKNPTPTPRNINIDITSYVNDESPGVIIISAYDKDGKRLLETYFQNIPQEADSIKIMIWNNLDILEPLMETIEMR